MKSYAKIKVDGVWSWYPAEYLWQKRIAEQLCQCRVCKPNTVCQEKVNCSEGCISETFEDQCNCGKEDSTPGVE